MPLRHFRHYIDADAYLRALIYDYACHYAAITYAADIDDISIRLAADDIFTLIRYYDDADDAMIHITLPLYSAADTCRLRH